MSGIYIPDMEMPSSCGGCKLVQRYRYSDECQYLHKNIAHNGRLKDCPLVEVPPHGDLIDADVLKETLMKSAYPEQREWYFAEACQFIDEAPTVIPASKGEASK